MSGRLVISRHKSWHVWNQDNVKRVRDDEQKQQEEEETKRLREKELLNEQILDALKRDNGSVKSGNGPVSEAPPEKFSLFDDPTCPMLSREGRKAIGNAEYRTEAEEKKQREAKRNGVAPWGLADVTNGLSPWYEKAGSHTFPSSGSRMHIMGREVAGVEAASALARDSSRKVMHDPMSSLLHPALYATTAPNSNTSSRGICYAFQKGQCHNEDRCWYSHNIGTGHEATNKPGQHSTEINIGAKLEIAHVDSKDVDCSFSSSSSVSLPSSTAWGKKEKKRKHNGSDYSSEKKKDKKSKSEKSKKSKLSKVLKTPKECNICFEMKSVFISLGDCAHEICDFCASAWDKCCPLCRGVKQSELDRRELRKRRLERENSERKKATLLLAKHDIYGPAVLKNTGNHTFNQQFCKKTVCPPYRTFSHEFSSRNASQKAPSEV